MNDNRSKLMMFLSRTRVDVAAMLILIVMLAVVKPILAVPGLIILGIVMNLNREIQNDRKTAFSDYFEDVATEMDETIAASVIFNPFPLCMIDNLGKILWCNEKFRLLFPEDEEIDGSNIYDYTGVKIHELNNEDLRDKVISISSINRCFRIQISETPFTEAEEDVPDMRTIRMLHWMEITSSEALKKTYRDERLCIVHITVDNLDDILTQAPEEKKASLSGEIEKAIRQWAVKCQAAVIRQSKVKYIVLCDSRNLENSEANKFPILDEVRAIDTGVDIPASLSIGVGAAGKNIAQTEEYAVAASELALGRGGDQAVVKKGSNVDYYGGKLVTVEKRNKGKSRIVALALRQLIDQSPRVFVMGHKLPDMDSFGAALGIARMAKNRGREVNIVIDSWDAIDMLYDMAVQEGEYRFIKSDYAKLIITREDLLVVVDTHKPSIAECGELATMADKVVVIDHHRRGEEMIANSTLAHIEPYASSTSELVTEMIQYTNSEKKGLSHLEAEGLLAGITVDTKNFSVKTGVRTFEAAAWLRRQGADTTVVRQFFQTDMNIFKHKAQIISRAKKLHGNVAISYSEEPYKNISVLIAMAADELLDIRGMRATFVIGENEEGALRVSARSLGDVNVQVIMEKIGGGGNLTTAGAQLDMSIGDALELIEKVVTEYISEQEAKEAKKQKQMEVSK